MKLVSWNVNGLRACLGKFRNVVDATSRKLPFGIARLSPLLEQRRQGGLFRHRSVHPAPAALRDL